MAMGDSLRDRVSDVQHKVEDRLPDLDGRAGAKLARALGWFSIGLGVAELAAPGTLGRVIGVKKRSGMLRAYGVREIASGVGILSGRGTGGWMGARIAGDFIDLGSLAGAITSRKAPRGRLAIAAAAVAGVTALDLVCNRRLSNVVEDVAQDAARAA